MALSAGEAELFGAAMGASVLIGSVSMTRDLGVAAKGVLHRDSSAARGIASRRGLGQVADVDVRNIWIQDVVRPGRFAVLKIRGGGGAADVLTKHLDGPAVGRRMNRLVFAAEGGRRKLASEVKERATT